MRRLCFLSVLLLAAIAPARSERQPHLVVANSLTLTAASDGFIGKLELLEDARLTPALEKTLWGSGGPEMALDQNDPRYKDLTTNVLLNAVLRLIDAQGKTVSRTVLEREQARIRFEKLYPGRRAILLTTDLSAGSGSYSGPVTELMTADGGRLKTVVARDEESGSSDPIRLMSTLKSAWKLVPAAASKNTQKDILMVACRPDYDAEYAGDFILTYTRYHWDGKGWIVLNRKVRGSWENDNEFPALEQFPAVVKPKRT
jgi:hypothetical protein